MTAGVSVALGELAVGDSVVYVPQHGPREDGVVTSLSANLATVFVRYAGQHPSAPGKSTRIADLRRTT